MSVTVEIYAFIGGYIDTLKGKLLKIDNQKDAGKPHTIPIPFYIIRHGNSLVAFDTGMNEECAVDPKSHWGEEILSVPFVPVMKPEDSFDKQLKRTLDIAPKDLDGVVLSHGHMDHAGGIHLFQDTEVPIFVQKTELETIKNGYPGYIPGDYGDLDKLNFTVVDGVYDLFGDGTVVAFPVPGHTQGLQSLMVKPNENFPYILTSDALDSMEQLDELLIPWAVWDESKVVQVLHTFRLLRLMGAEIVPSHDLLYWSKKPLSPKPFK